ncbi:MAG: acyl transferase [Calothrix sp. C42_A2020_038]|nr:acyl transferase [Calothrix sp. C42_A2020_038]
MTVLSTLLSFFPTLVMLMIFTSFLCICVHPGILSLSTLFFSIYIFPLLIYRIHNYFLPVQEGISYLCGKDYSPWWGSHQIQAIYISFPIFETILRLIPGGFSLWLRLWGSQVGKNVYWTPHIEIADRGLIQIGDNVIFGHQVGIYSHIIKPKKQDLLLYVKKVKIGSNVFLGAGNNVAPGVCIDDNTYIPISDTFPVVK